MDLDEIVLEEVARLPANAVRVDPRAVSGAQVRGVRGDLVRLVRNLLDNAARHADANVRISLVEEREFVELLVDDDGPGVPPDQRATIFERFARVDSGRGRREGGTGLGLAIAKAIVLDHDGSIKMVDAPLGGARLRVVLPVGTIEHQARTNPTPSKPTEAHRSG